MVSYLAHERPPMIPRISIPISEQARHMPLTPSVSMSRGDFDTNGVVAEISHTLPELKQSDAVNDHGVTMVLGNAKVSGMPLAYARDGKDTSMRDDGKVLAAHPFDSCTKLQNEVVYSRSLWQLNQIDIPPRSAGMTPAPGSVD
jgi:hypothetical protein